MREKEKIGLKEKTFSSSRSKNGQTWVSPRNSIVSLVDFLFFKYTIRVSMSFFEHYCIKNKRFIKNINLQNHILSECIYSTNPNYHMGQFHEAKHLC